MFKILFKDKNRIIEELDAKIASKQRDLKHLEDQLEVKRSDINTLETSRQALEKKLAESIYESVRGCKASLDWEKMNAFSVERMFSHKHNVPVTSIGYLVGNNVKEWILFVSEDIHNELVEEFKQYVATKTDI